MALTVAASLAQIGEFSFILAGLGVGLGVMPEDGRDLILAGAILSIMLHPFIVSVIERERKEAGELSEAPAPASRSEEHTSELQSLMRISYAVFCLKKKTRTTI